MFRPKWRHSQISEAEAHCRQTSERGFVLLPVILLITLLATVIFLLTRENASALSVGASEAEATQATYVAEAGLRHALHKISSTGTCTGYTDILNVPFGQNSYTATYSTASGSPVSITVDGMLSSGASHQLNAAQQAIYQPQTTLVMQPGVTGIDTYIRDGANDSNNFGASTVLKINNQSAEEASLLKFDLSAIGGAEIFSATLDLWLEGGVDLSNGMIDVHRVTQAWVEGDKDGQAPVPGTGSTYTSYNGQTNWANSGGDYAAQPLDTESIPALVQGWHQWDLTSVAQDWVSGSVPNEGVLLRASSGTVDKIWFTSGDGNAAENPKLTITYACECGQICASGAPGNNLLLVVADPTGLTAQEDARKSLIESWGYTVNLIDDTDSQFDLNTAAAANDVVYVSEDIDHTELLDKLRNSTTGIVNEEQYLFQEFGFSENRTQKPAAQIDIVDNSHYITSEFPAGLLTIYDSEQLSSMVINTAAGVQTLGMLNNVGPNWDPGLVVIELGGEMAGGGPAPARRVKLPFETISTLNANGQTLMRRAIEWAAGSSGAPPNAQKLLFVVGSAGGAGMTTEELAHQDLVESWGYTVEIIDDGASQGEFDTAVANNDVVFTTNDITASNVNTKLIDATIGVVTSEDNLSDEFGLSSSIAWESGSDIGINVNTHYITSPFPIGTLTVFSTSESLAYVTGTLSPDLELLARSTTGPALVTLGAGAAMYGGGTATGRRVQLPWGGSGFSPNNLNADGLTILQRAIEWGAGAGDDGLGPIAHWRLDDGTGLTAVDSVGGHDGTLLNGPAWVTGQIGDALQFDGSNDYVDLTSDEELDDVFVGGATVMTWLKSSNWGGNGYARIFDKSSSPSATNDGWAIRLNKDNGGLNFGQGFTSGRGWWRFAESSINHGTWQHIAVAYNASSTANDPVVYLDGNPISVTRVDTPSGTIRSDASINLRLGNHATGTSWSFDGSIDDARIYDRMLSDTEIAGLAAAGGGSGGGGPGYNEAYKPWSATNSDTWESVDLGAFGVPANAVVEVAVVNANTSRQYWGGVRKTGSTLDRRLQLHEAEGGGTDVMVMHVQADASSRIEHYSDTPSDVTFILLGYWRSGTFEERWNPFSGDKEGAWHSKPLQSFGVSSGSVAEVLIRNATQGINIRGGVREVGSNLSRIIDIHEAEGGGDDMATMFVTASADVSASIDVYTEDTGLKYILTGFWSTPPGVFNESDIQTTADIDGAWEDEDLRSFGVPANAVVQILMANVYANGEAALGARENGSSLERKLNLQEAESGGSDLGSMHVNADGSSVIQFFDWNVGQDHRFYLLGWWVLTP